MNVTFTCHHCGCELEADAELGGGQAQCPSCEATLLVPTPGIGPGVTLAGFRIEQKLGAGGMGEVFLATQLAMDRPVALKVLPPAMAGNPSVVERFLHEVHNQGTLDHPNIVTAFDAGQDSGTYYLAMSYVDGEDLEERLKRDGALPENEALTIVLKVARALNSAWDRHRMLHRDLKPSNIMIDTTGEVKLMDMGLSKSVMQETQLTMAGMVLGTPFYMSPEQAQSSEDLDFRSDIYSLGATLYHLVTGTVPYSGSSAVETMTQHVLKPFPPPQERNPAVSDGCAHLLEAMMAKEPGQRHASWEALIEDVGRVMAARPPAIQRPAAEHSGVMRPPENGAPRAAAPALPRKRSTLPLVLGALTACVLIAVVAAVAIHASKAKTRAAAAQRAKAEQAEARAAATPPPAAGATATKVVSAHEKAVAEMFAYADQDAKEHPGDYAGAIAAFRRVQNDATGTKYALMASNRVRDLEAAKAKAVAAKLADLTSRAEKLLAEGKPSEAESLLADYAGPLAAETATGRAAVSEKLRAAAAAKAQADQAAASQAQEVLAKLDDQVAEAVLTLDMAGALRAIEQAGRAAASPELDAMAEEFRELEQMPELVMASIKKQVGKRITADLKSGSESLEIEAVDGLHVKASKVFAQGRISREFTYSDLSWQEKLRRLGKEPTPATDRMKALLALEAGRPDTARQFFDRAGGRIAQAVAQYQEKQAEQEAARADTEAARAAETAAQQECRSLLALAGLPPDQTNVEALVHAALAQSFNEEAVGRIRNAVTQLRAKHGNRPRINRFEPLFKALETAAPVAGAGGLAAPPAPPAKGGAGRRPGLKVGTGPQPRVGRKPATLKALAEAVEELRKANPKQKPLVVGYQKMTDEGLQLRLGENPELDDLSPLAGLPLSGFSVESAAALQDISPLTGMPLKQLVLGGRSNVPVKDLTPLRSFKRLEFLSLCGLSPDADLTVVRSLDGLRSLCLKNCSLPDTSVLQGLELRTLSLDHVAIQDLAVLRSLKGLERLALQFLSVQDYSVLADLDHLQQLGVIGSNLPDISFLAQYRDLRALTLFNTGVADLSPLKQCKHLKSVILQGNPVRDLTPLAGLPLQNLHLSDTKVRDVSPLAKCRDLETLALPDTVENVEVLRKLPNLETINNLPADEFWKQHFLKAEE